MGLTRKDTNRELARVLEKLESDRYASFLETRITKIERGYAQAVMTVAEHMLNFNQVAHGGLIFSLADVAFAAAVIRSIRQQSLFPSTLRTVAQLQ